MESVQSWPSLTYETLPWERDPDLLKYVSKTRRRKITSQYRAAIPLSIANRELNLSSRILSKCSELSISLTRFDSSQKAREYKLPMLLLRSESSASSQIENLTSSIRNIALAELSEKVPKNAMLIAGNVAAMHKAMQYNCISIQTILEIHKTLIDSSGESFGGKFRNEQVWVGGTAYSPHEASFVPPHQSHINACLQDLISFAKRDDVSPLAQAAITHAQFETIHPFIDGNGRTGRALLHVQLAQKNILKNIALPISAGLLHNTSGYFTALESYHNGNYEPIIDCLLEAIEIALQLSAITTQEIDLLIDSWKEKITERKNSSTWGLINLLVEQPVLNSVFVAKRLDISDRAARSTLERACSYEIVRQIDSKQRGKFYQSDELIEILEKISSKSSIRRVLV